MSVTNWDRTDPLGTFEAIVLIDGMTCAACAARIERRLSKLDGIQASVSYPAESASVEMMSADQLSLVVGEIESMGYRATVPSHHPVCGGSEVGEPDDAVRYLGRRLIVAGLLFMPLCDLSLAFWFIPVIRFPGWQWVLIALSAPVLTWGAWPFYSAAIRHLRHGTFSMDTLVSLGIIASTAWSLYLMFGQGFSHVHRSIGYLFTHHTGGAIYIDVAVGVTTFLLAGRFYEALSRRRTGNALRSLAAVGAKDVAVLCEHDEELRLPVSQLMVGNRFVVRPGETVATDGQIVSGNSAVDRSAITGESVPVDVGPGDPVMGGTVSVGGRLVVRATRVGRDTQLAHMVRLVEEAQKQKAKVQRLADRVAGIFVPSVLAISLLTLASWLAAGVSTEQAFNAALSVLIIACPCALGLATPAALMVASGEGARLGIFFKGYQGIEASRQVDTVVLDKTGTITYGDMSVTDIESAPGIDPLMVLAWVGALEQASEHLVARAITAAARQRLGRLAPVENFSAQAGVGARGFVEGFEINVGRWQASTSDGNVPDNLTATIARWESLGRTVVLVGRAGAIVGAVALADTVRKSAFSAVNNLLTLGLDCILLTGDNESSAQAVGAEIGVSHVVADALPADKVALIRRLQAEGRSVAMVGDGVNDGPALVSADLGLAVGSGTDVAINAADLIVVRDDLRIVPVAVALARATLRTIRENLAWAFAYNVAAIPLAACGLLNPLIAGAAMALSSSFVLWNSARLRHFHCGISDRATRTAVRQADVAVSVSGITLPAIMKQARASTSSAEPVAGRTRTRRSRRGAVPVTAES